MEDHRSIANSNIKEFVDEIRAIIDQARHHAVRSIDHTRVLMYWNIGKRIFEKEQQGKERADYGSYLILNSATLRIVSGRCGQNRPECDFSCSNWLFAIS